MANKKKKIKKSGLFPKKHIPQIEEDYSRHLKEKEGKTRKKFLGIIKGLSEQEKIKVLKHLGLIS